MTRNASPHAEPVRLSEPNPAPPRWNIGKLLLMFVVIVGFCGYAALAMWAYGLFFGGRP